MDHLFSLRLPTSLASALARRATARRMPRAAVVREAVAQYLAPPPQASRRVTARELAARWRALPHLEAAERVAFAEDIRAARQTLPPAKPKWE